MSVLIREPYSRTAVRQESDEETKTKQSFGDECDVNMIIKKYQSTGVLRHTNPYVGEYGDFTGAVDLQDMLEKVKAAQADFEGLSADIRKAAGNSSVQFLKMLEDEEGYGELAAAGLIEKEVQEELPLVEDPPKAKDEKPVTPDGD